MNREERQQARTDRYRELADNARKQSEQCYKQSEAMASVIPMGQPVHGQSDRNYREKIRNKMGQSVKASEKADYYERKAEAAENNNAIYLDDDNAVEKLERKLAELVKAQEDMKAANKVVKNKKLTEEEKKVRLMEMGYSEKSAVELLTPCYGHIGFPSFSLSNNNANINRIKKRLELAKRMKGTPEKEYTINGVRVVENYPENRLQVFFDDVPAKEIRDSLKQHGFRWSRYHSCWQSYMNRRNIDFIKELLEETEA